MRRLGVLALVVAACSSTSGIDRGIGLGPATVGRAGAALSGVVLGLAHIGRAGRMRAVDPAAAAARDGAEVRTRRLPGVIEWWRAAPGGLEHGVTVAERPPGAGPLELDLALGGA